MHMIEKCYNFLSLIKVLSFRYRQLLTKLCELVQSSFVTSQHCPMLLVHRLKCSVLSLSMLSDRKLCNNYSCILATDFLSHLKPTPTDKKP